MSRRWSLLHLDLPAFLREEEESKHGVVSLPRIAGARGSRFADELSRSEAQVQSQSSSLPPETETSSSLLSRINALHAVLPQSLLLRRLLDQDVVASLAAGAGAPPSSTTTTTPSSSTSGLVSFNRPGRPPPRSRSEVLPYSENLPSSFAVSPLMLSSLDAVRGGRWGVGVGLGLAGAGAGSAQSGAASESEGSLPLSALRAGAPPPCTTDFRLSLESHYAASKIQNLWRRFFTKWRVWGRELVGLAGCGCGCGCGVAAGAVAYILLHAFSSFSY